MRPTVTLLVGLPASGKSTWRAENAHPFDFIFSTDDIVEEMAVEQNTTYDVIWSLAIKEATKLANGRLDSAIRNKLSVISDRTNLTVAGRTKFLARFPKSYIKKAVVFVPPASIDDPIWLERLKRPGKTIPLSVMKNMLESFKGVSSDENFDNVIVVDSWNNKTYKVK